MTSLVLNPAGSPPERIGVGGARWSGLFVMLPARLVFALLAQAAAAGLFAWRGHDQPWEAAAGWLPVWGSAVDVGCLLVLAFLARGEGLRLRDLLPRFQLRADGLTALAYAAVMLFVGGVGGTAIGFALYGHLPPSPMGHLPWWGIAYGVLVWPVLWGLTEQLTYNGYALPRLEALTRQRVLIAALVIGWWSLQHVAMPWRFDLTFVLYRGLSAIPAVACMVAIYWRSRRLGPLMAAHVLVDALAVLSAQAGPTPG